MDGMKKCRGGTRPFDRFKESLVESICDLWTCLFRIKPPDTVHISLNQTMENDLESHPSCPLVDDLRQLFVAKVTWEPHDRRSRSGRILFAPIF